MIAQLKHQHPELPSEEIARLHSLGFSLLPLGGGDDGKSPLLSFSGKDRIPVRGVLGVMHGRGSTCYGVRLPGLCVVDCDVDDPALVEELEARFGVSPVHVRTPRGIHLYYSAPKCRPPNLRSEDLEVDIKTGASSYVMGSGSVRTDGGLYVPAKGVLGESVLPQLRVEQSRPAASFSVGGRNLALCRAAIEMVETVDSQGELADNLKFIRDDQCEDPASIPDREVEGIAEWAWNLRLEGNVFHGRNSGFYAPRRALDAVRALPNAADAALLYWVLKDAHGHIHGKAFVLDHEGMVEAGRINLSRRGFRAARRALESVGLLEIASNHQAGKSARTYRLKRIRPFAFDEANVEELRK